MATHRTIRVALVGNPNCGKSTVFNALTGLRQKIANYPGVTVDKRIGTCEIFLPDRKEKITAEIIDLPGIYSLYPKSPDEEIPFRYLCGNDSRPDLVVLIADGSNLKRTLFLCTQVIDLKIPCILSLNMIDIVRENGMEIDPGILAEALGVQVIPTNARKNEGIDALKQKIGQAISPPAGFIFDTEKMIPEGLLSSFKEISGNGSPYRTFVTANNDKKKEVNDIFSRFGTDRQKLQALETIERYRTITGIIKKSVTNKGLQKRKLFSEKIDSVLTHRIWGYFIFLFILFGIFQSIFSWSSYPMDAIEKFFLWTGEKISEALPSGIFSDLLVNGIIAGLSGIVMFVPQIALLFAFIALLEDTGYMARVSFIMDKLMRRFGLHGKSVIPMISGFACAVPAIMSARTIQNRKERLITILVTPLMSCSARIPVYTLLISMVIPSGYAFGFVNKQALAMMLLYLTGIAGAMAIAWMLKKIIRTREKSYFVMEMPVYRMPRWSNVGYTMYEKVKVFLFDAGKVIIAISIILWGLSSYGPGSGMKEIEEKYRVGVESGKISPVESERLMQSEKLSASYAGRIGKWIEPAIEPLGFDWKIGIALVTSFAAREVFVGTMSTLYSVSADDEEKVTLKEKMLREKHHGTGLPVFTLASGISLMLFYAFAMQCMSTVAVVRREAGGWKWALIQFVYMGALAYLSAFIAYQSLT
jgi:ferrous iron transport protein B